jgi:hypothetical protein
LLLQSLESTRLCSKDGRSGIRIDPRQRLQGHTDFIRLAWGAFGVSPNQRMK